jgi:hypothetical protein
MLVYVKRSFLQQLIDAKIEPPENPLIRVESDNNALRSAIADAKEGISSNSNLVLKRKDNVAKIFGFNVKDAEEKRIPALSSTNSNSGKYNLVDTKWLREWVTGETVPWDDVEEISGAPAKTDTTGSNEYQPINVDDDDNDYKVVELNVETTDELPPNALRGAVPMKHLQFCCNDPKHQGNDDVRRATIVNIQ